MAEDKGNPIPWLVSTCNPSRAQSTLDDRSCQGVAESKKVPPESPFPQAEPPQLLLISLVFQPLPQLHCLSLDSLQYLNVFLTVRGPELDTELRVQLLLTSTPSPICFDMIEEAYMTKCGHSFCFHPSHESTLLRVVVWEVRVKKNGHRWQIIQDLLGTDQDNLDLANVNLMLELLVQKKKQLEAESHAAQLQILMEFLKVARRNKREKVQRRTVELGKGLEHKADEEQQLSKLEFFIQKRRFRVDLITLYTYLTGRCSQQLEQIQKELSVLEEDIKRVEEMSGLYSPVSEDSTVPQFEAPSPSHSSIIDSTEYTQPPGFSGSSQTKKQPWYNSTLASRRKRLTAHFEDLEQCYFSTRMTRVSVSKTEGNMSVAIEYVTMARDKLSIEFDRDCDYFAIAGVTKKIKVYEYGTVIQDAVDIHYPENEMTCNSKISCISWSSYHKNLLASSDYEGTVILWDGFTGQRSKVYQEHEKRCWSVDFNLMDPKLLASGSDDAKVKLWSTNLDNSVASIEAKANVCCVKFSPSSRYHLAFGCAGISLKFSELHAKTELNDNTYWKHLNERGYLGMALGKGWIQMDQPLISMYMSSIMKQNSA
ncbi:E3 ubiquitin-protein ligase RFWD2 [Willisornis vidua]|uniref:E3 ubiquitin-protein ligase RFWD2 n=1 Tax=Willisornis vidua TaxID=1566151 RepID=A0ABQ9DGP5_9PASS|nr:E3 ubiquitin-protein ligase RFWD2 [Willisornis vidua]